MAVPTRKEVIALVKKARKYLDTQVYPDLFKAEENSSYTRVPDKVFKKDGKIIHLNFVRRGRAGSIWEKVSTVTGYAYFELEHKNREGMRVRGMGAKSQANILTYVIWDKFHEVPIKVYFLSVPHLRNLALEARKNNSKDIGCFEGEGEFKVVYWRFDPSNLPEDCYITFLP